MRAYELAADRLNSIDGRFEAIDRRFEAIDRRFEAIDRRFEAVDRRFDGLDRKIENRFVWTMGTVLGTWLTTVLTVVGFGFEIIQRLPAR